MSSKSLLRLAAATFAALLSVTAVLAQSAFPVTIKHALGETTIPAAPQRIVTLGWSSQDAVVALGGNLVGTPSFRSEGFDHDLLPWTEAALKAKGAAMPEILATGDIPLEQIAALKPDLIVAVYSGVTEEEYDALSQIAPVVPYPETPWTASWQQVIDLTGQALGKPDEAKALVSKLEGFITSEAAKRPDLAGTSVVTLIDYNGQAGVHSKDDARAKLLTLAGMTIAPPAKGAGEAQGFWYPLSYENFANIPAQVIIGYFNTPALADEFFARPYIALAEQVKKGAFVKMDNRIENLGVISSSALSIEYSMPRYFDLIEAAALNAKK